MRSFEKNFKKILDGVTLRVFNWPHNRSITRITFMKGRRFLPVGMRRVAFLAVGLVGSALQSHAQPYGITNDNSFALIDPSSSAGMYNWSVVNTPTSYQNQLNQQWFWYR